MSDAAQQYSLNQLCILADMPVRTFRYYVQNGLVERPDGGTKGAKYGSRHLEQVLLIKKWTSAGVSLERIRELLHGGEPVVPAKLRKAGSVEVCSHLIVSDGVEVVIEPTRAGLTPEQVRRFVKGVMALYASISAVQQADESSEG